MPTSIFIDSSPNAQGINVASDNDKVSGKRKIDVDRNERSKRHKEEGVDHLVTSSRSQCWPCGISSDSNHHKVSKEKKRPEKKICPTPGCDRQAQVRGHCKVHDPEGGYICKRTGCSKACRQKGTHCRSHASTADEENRLKKCKMPECSNLAHARGLCRRHDPSYAQCMKDNCFLQAKVAGGFCRKHDPMYQKCMKGNCNNQVQSRGFCRKHDPMYKKCMKENCNNQVQCRGFCSKHDPYWKKCKEENCNFIVRARGRCRKHDKMYGKKKKRS